MTGEAPRVTRGLRVGYTGEPGAFAEEAVLRFFAVPTAVPSSSFRAVFEGVRDGTLDAGSLWILFLDGRGGVRAKQKIGHFEGGFVGTPNIWDFFGISLAYFGDLDGDGKPELAVGSEEDDGGSSTGAVHLLSLNVNGTVNPGTTTAGTTGTLHTGSVNLQTNSSFAVQLNGTTAGSGHDQLDVTGSVTLAGNLGFRTHVVADACFTFDKTDLRGVHHAAEEVHQMALANLHGEYATVIDAAAAEGMTS